MTQTELFAELELEAQLGREENPGEYTLPDDFEDKESEDKLPEDND